MRAAHVFCRLTKEDLTDKLTTKMAGDICATVVQERRRKESVKQQNLEREQLMQRVAELKKRRQVGCRCHRLLTFFSPNVFLLSRRGRMHRCRPWSWPS